MPPLAAMPSMDALDLDGRAVFMRLDLNTPLQAGRVTSRARIAAALPSIRAALARGARLTVASHLGRPRGQVRAEESLEPVAKCLSEMLQNEVRLADDCVGDGVLHLVRGLRPGQLLMLENLRFHAEEEANNPDFARLLAAPFEVYVNDAFGAAHRPHASVVGVPQHLPARAAGPLMAAEVTALGRLLTAAERPFVAVVGGAKVSDKIGVLEALLPRVDTLCVGGAMAYTFLAAQKFVVGNSRVEADKLAAASELLARAKARGVELLLPSDHVVAERFAADAPASLVSAPDIPAGRMGLDIGPDTRAAFAARLHRAKTIFWNGPMGVFEWPPFAVGTRQVAAQVADSGAFSVVGGGDSVAAVEQAQVADRIGHISTGGGASLEFLESGTLPGIAALTAA